MLSSTEHVMSHGYSGKTTVYRPCIKVNAYARDDINI